MEGEKGTEGRKEGRRIRACSTSGGYCIMARVSPLKKIGTPWCTLGKSSMYGENSLALPFARWRRRASPNCACHSSFGMCAFKPARPKNRQGGD
jgi:hypothetical protein